MYKSVVVQGIGFTALLAFFGHDLSAAQQGARDGEWPTYGGDLGSTRYSPLDHIAADNFGELEVAWRFKTQNLGPYLDFNLQVTPIMVGGVLYAVVARSAQERGGDRRCDG